MFNIGQICPNILQ